MKKKKPFIRQRRGVAHYTPVTVETNTPKDLRCSRCKAIFPDYLARCPECGSEDWVGLVEVNPYTRMPMENFLKACGHILWLLGTVGFLFLLWQTDTANEETNLLYMYGAVLLLFCSVLFSAAYFGMSEIMKRMLRVQRRLRAFHENYQHEEANRHEHRRKAQPSAARQHAVQHSLEIRRSRTGRLPVYKAE